MTQEEEYPRKRESGLKKDTKENGPRGWNGREAREGALLKIKREIKKKTTQNPNGEIDDGNLRLFLQHRRWTRKSKRRKEVREVTC